MELTAGVGGQEAMLFCSELLDMYCSYCDFHGWDNTITGVERSDLEGVRHASVTIDHPGNISFSVRVMQIRQLVINEYL